jgi:hypothetical protein
MVDLSRSVLWLYVGDPFSSRRRKMTRLGGQSREGPTIIYPKQFALQTLKYVTTCCVTCPNSQRHAGESSRGKLIQAHGI